MPKRHKQFDAILPTLPADAQRSLAAHSNRAFSILRHQLHAQIHLSESDKIRCIRWISWSRHFNVPLSYVISKSLEWGTLVATSRIKARRRATHLPLTIATLTSSACRDYVVECATAEGILGSSLEARRERMIADILEMPVSRPKGGPLSYASLSGYTDDYRERLGARRAARMTAEETLRRSKPFRGNPFR